MPVVTAELRLDLLVKINSELPGENGSCNHDFGKISAKIIGSAVAQTFAHGSPQALTLSPELSARRNAVSVNASSPSRSRRPSASAMILGSVAIKARSGSGSPPRMESDIR